MVSIKTNGSAIAALATLRAIDVRETDAQQQISSGLRISKAADNSAYWSISTTMRSENKSLSAVADSIAVAQGIVDTAYAATETVHDYMVKVRDLLVLGASFSAEDPSYVNTVHAQNLQQRKVSWPKTKLGELDREITGLLKGVVTTVNSASFAGTNLLVYSDQSKALAQANMTFVSGYVGGKVLTTSLKQQDVAMFDNMFGATFASGAQSAHSGTLDHWVFWSPMGGTPYTNGFAMFPTNTYDSPYGQSQITLKDDTNIFLEVEHSLVPVAGTPGYSRGAAYSTLIDSFDNYLSNIVDGMATLGAVRTRLDNSLEYNRAVRDSYASGIGRLVDADMNEASTRLKALQTQQQLGIQALQIANNTPNAIMQLFR